MTRQYRSAACAAIHETMAALRQNGLVDAQTMHEFDAACLTPEALRAAINAGIASGPGRDAAGVFDRLHGKYQSAASRKSDPSVDGDATDRPALP